MPVMPPNIDVYTPDDVRNLSRTMQSSFIQTSTYLYTLSKVLEKRIVTQMQAEGIDSGSRFRSDAAVAAKMVTRPLLRIASLSEDAAILAVYFDRAFQGRVVEPIMAARNARSGAGNGLKI